LNISLNNLKHETNRKKEVYNKRESELLCYSNIKFKLKKR